MNDSALIGCFEIEFICSIFLNYGKNIQTLPDYLATQIV